MKIKYSFERVYGLLMVALLLPLPRRLDGTFELRLQFGHSTVGHLLFQFADLHGVLGFGELELRFVDATWRMEQNIRVLLKVYKPILKTANLLGGLTSCMTQHLLARRVER